MTSTTEQPITQKADRQGIFISVARVRKYLNEEGLNKSMCDAINELTAASVTQTPLDQLSDATQAIVVLGQKEVASRKDLETKREEKRKLDGTASVVKTETKEPVKPPLFHQESINAVRTLKTRFSSESYTLVASVICTAINELIDRGISALSAEKTKTLMPHHLLVEGDTLTFADLYKRSKAYTSALNDEAKRQRDIEWKKELAKKQRSKSAAFNGVEWKKTEASPESTVPGMCQAVNTVKVVNGPFHTSAGNIFKHIISVRTQDVKGTTKFSSYRISKDVKNFCSDIVVSMLDRLRRLIRGELDRSKAKTVSPDTIRSFLNVLFILDGFSSSDVSDMFDVLAQKMTLYEGYMAERRELLAQKKVAEEPTASE